MNTLKLVGIKNDQYLFFKKEITQAMILLDGNFTLDEANDLDTIFDLELESIPALFVNNKLVLTVSGYMPNAEEIGMCITKYISPIACFKKIVIPIDFSKASKNAFIYGQHFANICDQNIHILHVVKPQIGLNLGFTDFAGLKAKNLLAFITQNRIGKPTIGLDYSSEIASGTVTSEIIKCVDKVDGGLIIMSTTGKSKKNQLLGSVSQKISMNGVVPTLLVPSDVSYKPFKKIVFAAKHNEANTRLAEDLRKTSVFDGAELFVVEVDIETNLVYKIIKKESNDHFSSLLIQDENLVSGLTKFIHENDIDLLVMHKPYKPFWQTIFHKSNTKEMHKNINIPLLLLR